MLDQEKDLHSLKYSKDDPSVYGFELFAKDNFLLLSKYLPKNRIDIIVKDVIVKFLMPSNDCRSII